MTVSANERDINRIDNRLTGIEKIVKGNGDPGMDEDVREMRREVGELNDRMDALETTVGVTNSEINHFRNVYFQREGLDVMGNPRVKTWAKKAWEKASEDLVGKLITAFMIVLIINAPGLFAEIAEQLSK